MRENGCKEADELGGNVEVEVEVDVESWLASTGGASQRPFRSFH